MHSMLFCCTMGGWMRRLRGPDCSLQAADTLGSWCCCAAIAPGRACKRCGRRIRWRVSALRLVVKQHLDGWERMAACSTVTMLDVLCSKMIV